MADDLELLVLRCGVHGKSAEAYASRLRTRLPDVTVNCARTPAEERSLIADARFVTGTAIDESLLEHARESLLEHARALSVFACTYVGTGHLPLEARRKRSITVTNAAGVHGPNVAEHVLGAILGFARRFHVGRRQQGTRTWRHYPTRELQGSTVTVFGLGAIGTAVLERLEPFGVDTIGVRYTPEKGGRADEVVGFDSASVHDALARSDYVVLACPLTDETRGLLSRPEFATLPSDAVIINLACGPVVDTDALCRALQRGHIRGASLDVTDPEPLPPDHPLWRIDAVQLTPHNAGDTPRYYDRLAAIVGENVDRIRETGSYTGLRNQVVPDAE